MAKGHASQCGFCTSGVIMAFYSLLKLNPTPTVHDIEESFDGNLCRCVGYRAILDVAHSFAVDAENHSSDCKKLANFTEFKKYDPAADLPFPPSLVNKKLTKPFVVNFKDRADQAWVITKIFSLISIGIELNSRCLLLSVLVEL